MSEPEKDWRSEPERRLRGRMCRCGRPADVDAEGCLWHPAVSAEYARDLQAEIDRMLEEQVRQFTAEVTPHRAARMVVAVMWRCPWSRVVGWAMAIEPDTLEIKKDIRSEWWTWRNLLVRFAEWRERAWLDRWATAWLNGTNPPDRWRRT